MTSFIAHSLINNWTDLVLEIKETKTKIGRVWFLIKYFLIKFQFCVV